MIVAIPASGPKSFANSSPDQPWFRSPGETAPMNAICRGTYRTAAISTEPMTAKGTLRFGFSLSPASSTP